MIDPTEIVEIRTPAGVFLGRLSKEQYEAVCELAKGKNAVLYRRIRLLIRFLVQTLSNALFMTPAILLWGGVLLRWAEPETSKALVKQCVNEPAVLAFFSVAVAAASQLILWFVRWPSLANALGRNEVERVLVYERLAQTLKLTNTTELIAIVRSKGNDRE